MQGLIESAKDSVKTKFKDDLIMNIYHEQKKELLEGTIGAVRYKLSNRFKSYLDDVKRRSIALISMEIKKRAIDDVLKKAKE